MKNKHLFLAVFFAAFCMVSLMSCATTIAQDQPPPPDAQGQNYDNQPVDGPDQQPAQDINYDQFNTALSPYGHWENTPEYGMVWICNEPDFRPYYTNGYWNYADGSWIWVSNYSWGWAPFHYGRWQNRIGFGWCWVPGYEWAPAWVGWRHNGEHYGWAPLGPGISFSMAIGGGWNCPDENWTFVPHRYITEHNFAHYAVDRHENATYVHNTTYIKNVKRYQGNRAFAGPKRNEVASHIGRPITNMNVHNVTKPQPYHVAHNAVHVYRPQVTPHANYTPNGGGYHPAAPANNGGGFRGGNGGGGSRGGGGSHNGHR